jgi:protoporphyrinogen oxidase
MGKKFLAQVYEEYLDNLTEGIYEGYCLELSIGEIRA